MGLHGQFRSGRQVRRRGERGGGPGRGRTSRRTTYGTHFQGYYAQLWSHNIDTANSDAGLLASRLRDVAKGIRDLEADARAEQARINTARQWKAERDSRSNLEKFGETVDFLHLFHSDSNAPKADPVPQMVKTYEAPAQGARGVRGHVRDRGVVGAAR